MVSRGDYKGAITVFTKTQEPNRGRVDMVSLLRAVGTLLSEDGRTQILKEAGAYIL